MDSERSGAGGSGCTNPGKSGQNITVQACVDVLDLLAAERLNKVSLQTERSVKRE